MKTIALPKKCLRTHRRTDDGRHVMYASDLSICVQCLRFHGLGIRYVYSWYNGRPSTDIFYRLMSETNPALIKKTDILYDM